MSDRPLELHEVMDMAAEALLTPSESNYESVTPGLCKHDVQIRLGCRRCKEEA